MKRKAVLLAMAVFLLCQAAFAQTVKNEASVRETPSDIIDYYLIIPSDYMDSSVGGLSFQKRLDYLKETNDFKKVTVDVKNAYIFISSFSGDLSANQTLSYFIKADKSKVIAVSVTRESGECGSMSECRLLTYTNGKFADVTSALLPAFHIQLFARDSDKKKVTAMMNRKMRFRLELPRYGTVCKLYPEGICEVDNGLSRDEDTAYRDIEKNFPWAYIELRWDKNKGKFELGQKAKK